MTQEYIESADLPKLLAILDRVLGSESGQLLRDALDQDFGIRAGGSGVILLGELECAFIDLFGKPVCSLIMNLVYKESDNIKIHRKAS